MTLDRLGALPNASALLARSPAKSAGIERLAQTGSTTDRPSTREPTRLQQVNVAGQPLTDAETVLARLEEAGHTLLCLPRSGPTTGLRQTHHQYVSEALEGLANSEGGRPRPPIPSPLKITRMDQALAWIPLIPADKLVLRRIVGCRALVSPLTGRHLFSWRRLARLLGADHKAIKRWHGTGIDMIVASLNRNAALPQSQNALR